MTDDYFTILPEPPGTGADGVVTSRILLSGEFDLDSRDQLRDAMLAPIDAGTSGRVVVDMRKVRFIDSEAISAIIDAFLAAEQAGIVFRLAGTTGIVDRVITVVGLGHLVDR
ncbi:STAS domain-containing protein [Actinoplanes sp. GCM10030250]|uniref:STAS domain-containing protein n=1 Tax=Actinoplanes sp. GCM10030250 TaxID=3273376 RepID=UPI00360A9CAB